MTRRTAVLLATAALIACGEDFEEFDAGVPDAGPSAYPFTSGTYAVSNALASGADQCGLLPAYQDPQKKIGVSVDGTTATFNLANDPSAPANTLPKAVVRGNAIEQPTEANYTVAFGNTCVVRVKRSVSGNVVANNTAALTLTFSVQTETGTCSSSNTSFANVPCAATYQFTATRQ